MPVACVGSLENHAVGTEHRAVERSSEGASDRTSGLSGRTQNLVGVAELDVSQLVEDVVNVETACVEQCCYVLFQSLLALVDADEVAKVRAALCVLSPFAIVLILSFFFFFFLSFHL